MAMPTIGGSNCIGLRSCPNNLACSAIGQAVCPGTTTTIYLSDMSARAGKAVSVSAFSGYNPNYVTLLCTGSLGTDGVSLSVNRCHCVVYSYTRTVGNCYCICLTANLSTTNQVGSCAAFCVICNAVSKLTCQIGQNASATPSVSFLVDNNDTVSMCACAYVPTSGIGASCSIISMSPITPVVGEWSAGGLTACDNHCTYTV